MFQQYVKTVVVVAASILTSSAFANTNKLIGTWTLESCKAIEMKKGILVQTGAADPDPCKSEQLLPDGAMGKIQFKEKFISLADDRAIPTKYLVDSEEVVLENESLLSGFRFKFDDGVNKTTVRYRVLDDKATLTYVRLNSSPLPQQNLLPPSKK